MKALTIKQHHWVLANPRELRTPVVCRGRLGVFDLPDPVATAVNSSFCGPDAPTD